MNGNHNKPELIAEFFNHRRATAILAADDGFVWVRTYAQHPAEHYQAEGTEWRSRSQPVRITSGRSIGSSWATKLEESKAFHSRYSVEGHTNDSFDRDIASLGAALGEHEHSRRIAEVPRSNPLIVRFLSKMPTSLDALDSSPAILHSILTGRASQVRALLDSWFDSSEPLHQIHGEYSMANFVRAADAGLVLLCDPVRWRGPFGFDAGWFLGDLAELVHSPLSPFTLTDAVRAGKTFLDGYHRASGHQLGTLPGIRVGLLLRIIYHYVEYRTHPLSSGTGEEGLVLLDLELAAGRGSLGSALGLHYEGGRG